jgi:hypothetical protein
MPHLDLSNLEIDYGVSRKEYLLVDLTIDEDVAKRPRYSVFDLTGDDDEVIVAKRPRCLPSAVELIASVELLPSNVAHSFPPVVEMIVSDNLLPFPPVVIESEIIVSDNLLPSKVAVNCFQKLFTGNLRKLSRDLIMKIFDDYLNISFIKEILMTPTDILRTSICIHNSMISRHVAPKLLMDINSLSNYIFTHIGDRAPLNIIYANINLKMITSLQINDTLDYYEPHRKGRYIITKVLKSSADIQKIKYTEKKLLYNGLTFITIRKVSSKRTISFKNLNERCVFSSIRNQNICFVNNLGTPIEVVYYTGCSLIVEKHRNMSPYTIV